MRMGDFSVPNLKIKVVDVKYYVASGKFIKCVARFKVENSFSDKLCWALQELYDISFISVNSNVEMQKTNNSRTAIFISNSRDGYEGVGYARLKENDTNDIDLARKVALKKAYRNFIRLYYGNYDKILTMLEKCLNVGLEQFDNVVYKDILVSSEICELVYDEDEDNE